MKRPAKYRPSVKLDQDVLKSILHYDPLTGMFTWLSRIATTSRQRAWNTRYAGKQAGCEWRAEKSNTPYIVIHIFDRAFFAHRLAVLYMTGEWPDDHTDHKDLDGINNRWLNLRAATHSQNLSNSRLPSRNKSGFKGVRPHKHKWVAVCAGKYLGLFSTPEEASAAYLAAATTKSGEFARAA
jgi:hypothetical protein